jgi:signal transduction histidine kinase
VHFIYDVMSKRKKTRWSTVASKFFRLSNQKPEEFPARLHDEQYLTAVHETKTRLAAELLVANMDLTFHNEEQEKRDSEIKLANQEQATQHEEKEKRESESMAAQIELSIQHEEKVKMSAELLVANMTVAFQHEEKEKRAEELATANEELFFQNGEKEKRAAELLVVNEELVLLNGELTRAEEYQAEYIRGLEQMMFLTSHRVRQPVANILGIAQLLDSSGISPKEFEQAVRYMKESALKLDAFTKELTTFIEQLGRKTRT